MGRPNTFLTAKSADLEESRFDDSNIDPSSRSSPSSPSRSGWGASVPSAFIFSLGCITAAAFVWFGVSAAIDEQNAEFQRSAADTTNKLQDAFEDYSQAASTVHMRCRHRNFTRQDFREAFEYLMDGGLRFKAVQFNPMFTHAERPGAEEEARAYYAEHYPHVDYQGFRGFNYPNSTTLEPRIEQPFYFPIHYQEPVVGNEAAIDLDYHSSESRTRAVDALFETKGPSLTDRLSLVKKKGEVSRCGAHNGPSYGVVLMHPGVELSQPQPGDEVWPRDFSTIVLCVPDLLARSIAGQSKSSFIYIHDQSTPGAEDGEPVFMGGAQVEIADFHQKVDFLDEVKLSELSAKLKEQSSITVANRVWTVTVLSMDDTYEPDILFVCLGGAFVLLGSVFLAIWVYTWKQAQYMQVLATAERSTAIVTSLFPKNVAKQMMDYDVADREGCADTKSKPIADLFPSATIIFADMVGFTEWSSMREPTDVFLLLETVYAAFDEIAARRKVFKVETIGDCYVAVCGLPEPCKNHAVVMARFAHECACISKSVLRGLEAELGPETSTLDFRVGLHSGAVTGGVLRGQRARFQLFGDTVNTAARMESTGKKGAIHVSTATADLIREAGWGEWVVPREDKVHAKGLGFVDTCWLSIKSDDRAALGGGASQSDHHESYRTDESV
ncbi:Receptor-type guanylate cyclase gcy [Seminavis robusta]|uniref:Receptor-type guanylate cyclase gcy n=1 Tax=Seminavis robusta TaxID=568900 RepID=A0A9N8ELZ0_9STRA|nr:Receptor-type guanylate cyclase gcy [Seminavis robusta]|eukprot:Sro1378_g267650.1 Receptor-type guanylate cyclase gcy (669) ;mRNA; f:19249-21455